jgi:GDPmannose 4,6-dehydratase
MGQFPAAPVAMTGTRRTALITGITGQDGSYMADLLLEKGYRVVGLVRPGSHGRDARIRHLGGRIELVESQLCDQEVLQGLLDRLGPAEVYNFAARASSSQLADDPVRTGEVNGLLVTRLLAAIHAVDPAIRFCQASSSELFGRSRQSPQSETTAFHPRNPYGVAKLYGHWAVVNYRESRGLFACSSILFNHESPRRGVEFVTRKITRGVASIKLGKQERLHLGDLEARRDWGFAGDYVRAMWQMLQASSPDDYVLATGEPHSVRDFCRVAFERVALDYEQFVVQDLGLRRPAEAAHLVGDAAKARRVLGWSPTVSFEQLVHMMVDADLAELAGGV